MKSLGERIVENNSVFVLPVVVSYGGVKLYQNDWTFTGYVICGLSAAWLLLTVAHTAMETYLRHVKATQDKKDV